MSKATNKTNVSKVETNKVEQTNVIESANVSRGKYKDCKYDSMNSIEQKKFRTKKREDLFRRIAKVSIYVRDKNKLSKEQKIEYFENFKKFFFQTYNLALTEFESAFLAGEKQNMDSIDWRTFCIDFKDYLNGKMK